MSPEEIAALIDYRHILDALRPEEAVDLLKEKRPGRSERLARMKRSGLSAYTTSAGWLGYSEDKVRALCREATGAGWKALKFKVGRDDSQNLARCRIAREELGPGRRLMIDANQVWEVDEAIARVRHLSSSAPWWIEEPVSPDDILGHRKVADAVRPVRVATGEHCQNRIMFKQFLQADAIDVVQVDACRLAGLNENLAVLIMAAKFGKVVCPHAGGVGLCEYVQHIGAIDQIAIGGDRDDRMVEFAGHLHEHFVDPVDVHDGAYWPTEKPGFSVTFLRESMETYRYPDGAYWRAAARTGSPG
jgi:L-fuconate dehydratase